MLVDVICVTQVWKELQSTIESDLRCLYLWTSFVLRHNLILSTYFTKYVQRRINCSAADTVCIFIITSVAAVAGRLVPVAHL